MIRPSHRPSGRPITHRGLGLDEPARAESEPTRAMPGTWEKIEVMRRRNEAGLPIFNPKDARDYD